MALTKYSIGQLIELTTETNKNGSFGVDDVRGMTITKQIISTKADVSTTDLSKFLVIRPHEFVFNPRTHGKHIGFGYNNTDESFIISWNNIGFRVKEDMKNVVSSEYLFLHFNRDEWDREACFRSWGSSTEVFTWEALCEMVLELPDLPIQQKYVDIYKAMVANQQCYERGLEDLKLVCDGYIEDLRRKMPCEKIGGYIKLIRQKNTTSIAKVLGISKDGFIEPKQNIGDIKNYFVFKKNDFVYSPPRINIGSIGLYKENSPAVCSPIYVTFRVLDINVLLPEYLLLWLKRSEFLRATDFYSIASVRNNFSFDLMQEVQIPIPKIEIQQDIVDIYNTYIARKEINEKLKAQIKDICSILIKGSLEEGK